MELVKNVTDLRVFQLAYIVSLDVHKVTQTFPKSERYDLTSQMRRASKSICANLAEGYEKQQFSKPEFLRFISLTIGSCGEMRVWIQYAHDLGYIDQAQFHKWAQDYASISRMLQKLHTNSNNRQVRSSGHPVIRTSRESA